MIINKYLQREGLCDEIDFLEQKGGYEWLKTGLDTDFENGISSSTLEDRDKFYQNNKRKVQKPRSILFFIWEALKDFILRILLVAGILSIILNMIVEKDH